MEPKINLLLTTEEFSLIMESLLFACSVDANADWDYDDTMKIKDILLKLRVENPTIPTNRINVLSKIDEKYEYNDLHTEELIKYFPEIALKESFI
jgi:hypothetical protein